MTRNTNERCKVCGDTPGPGYEGTGRCGRHQQKGASTPASVGAANSAAQAAEALVLLNGEPVAYENDGVAVEQSAVDPERVFEHDVWCAICNTTLQGTKAGHIAENKVIKYGEVDYIELAHNKCAAEDTVYNVNWDMGEYGKGLTTQQDVQDRLLERDQAERFGMDPDSAVGPVLFTEQEWDTMLSDPAFGYVCQNGHDIRRLSENPNWDGNCLQCEMESEAAYEEYMEEEAKRDILENTVPVVRSEWNSAGISDDDEIADWLHLEYDADEAAGWKGAGFDANGAYSWRSSGYTPADAKTLSETFENGYNAKHGYPTKRTTKATYDDDTEPF